MTDSPANRTTTDPTHDQITQLVTDRVTHAYREEDLPCTPTTLRILSELFEIELSDQVYEASIGMNGAGKYGAQCGLVEGALMFVSIVCRQRGMSIDETGQACNDFAASFEAKFGTLICRELRPEGFSEDNPPHLCEPRSIDAITHAIAFVADRFKLAPQIKS